MIKTGINLEHFFSVRILQVKKNNKKILQVNEEDPATFLHNRLYIFLWEKE